MCQVFINFVHVSDKKKSGDISTFVTNTQKNRWDTDLKLSMTQQKGMKTLPKGGKSYYLQPEVSKILENAVIQ